MLAAPLSVKAATPLPIAELVRGKPVEEVAALLPRVFNLCREAQGVAVRLALGLDVDAGGLGKEIVRDHLLRLGLILPKMAGLPTLPVARGPETLWGEGCPQTVPALKHLMRSGEGLGPLLQTVKETFLPGEACASLAPVTEWTALETRPLENSVAQRRSGHPLMLALESALGRGPLWRLVGRMLDLDACLKGHLPKARRLGVDAAMVPAARGSYAIRLICEGGHVQALTRVTPTDHLLARGGVMDQCLGSLRPENQGLAPLVVEILDPCTPVELEGGSLHA
ncbi:hypothetical protein [Tropicibacter sp. S64]|uniref:hypothetical protein n=1 Tax=Tropicibacter sp. S64 TaxID=3415122 RepID=UPI003C7B3F0A